MGNAPSKESGRENTRTKNRVNELNQAPAPIVDRQPSHNSTLPTAPEASGTDVAWTSSGGANTQRQGAEEHLRMYLCNSRDDVLYRDSVPGEDGFGELSQMRNRLSGVSRHPSVYSDMQSSSRSISMGTRPTGSRMSMPPQDRPVDLEATISILQELRKTVSPEQLVALHRALLPTKEEASMLEARSTTPGSDSGAALVRRRSLAVPGLATRDTFNVLRKKEEPSPPIPASVDGQWWGFEDFGPASPSLIMPAFESQQEETKTNYHVQASGDELDDYSHLGKKIGKLTITNGAPSPVPSTMSRCVEQEISMRDLLETEKAALGKESADISTRLGSIARIPPLVLESTDLGPGTTNGSKAGPSKRLRPVSPHRGVSYVRGDDSHAMGQPSPTKSVAEEYVAELAAGGNPFHYKTHSPRVSHIGFIDEGFHEARSPTKSREAAAARIADVRDLERLTPEDTIPRGTSQGKLQRPVHLHHPDSGYSSGVSLNAVNLASGDSQYAGTTVSSPAPKDTTAEKQINGTTDGGLLSQLPEGGSGSRPPTENGDAKKRKWLTDRVKHRRRLSMRSLSFAGSGMNCADSSRPGSRASYLEPAKPVPTVCETPEKALSTQPSRRKLQKRRLSRLAQFLAEEPTVTEGSNGTETSFSVLPSVNSCQAKSDPSNTQNSTETGSKISNRVFERDSERNLSRQSSAKGLRSETARYDDSSLDSQRPTQKGKAAAYQQGEVDEQQVCRSIAPSRPSSSGTSATKTTRSKGKASAAKEARALSIKVLREQAAAALDAQHSSELAILRGRGSTVPDLASPSTSPSRYDRNQSRSRPNSYHSHYGNEQQRSNARRADTPNFSRPHSVVSSCDSPPPLPDKRVSGLSLNTDVGNFASRRKSKSSLREQEEKIVVEYPEEKICVDSENPEDLMPKRDSSDSKFSSGSKVSSDEGKTDSPIAGWEASKVYRQRTKPTGDDMRLVSIRRKSIGEGIRPRATMDRAIVEERRKSTGEGIIRRMEERSQSPGDFLGRSNGMRRKSVSEGLLDPEFRRKGMGGEITTPTDAPPMPTRRAPREPPSHGNGKSNRRHRSSTLTPVFATTNVSTSALSEPGYSEPPTPMSANSSDLNLPAYFVPSPRASQISLPAYFLTGSASSSAGSGPAAPVPSSSSSIKRTHNHHHRRSYAAPSSRWQPASRPHSLALQLNSGGSVSTSALPLLNHSSSSSVMRDQGIPPIPIPPRSPQRPGPRIIDRYSGGFRFNYEHGVGVGGSAGTRGPETRARKKSMTWTSMFGVDLEDVPVLVS